MCLRFEPEEFCNICASYVLPKNRRKITDEFMEMYADIYGEDINLNFYAPSSICSNCLISIRKFISGKHKDLKIKTPAKWGDYRCDHRDCFYHLVKVDIETGKTDLPEVRSFVPPDFES